MSDKKGIKKKVEKRPATENDWETNSVDEPSAKIPRFTSPPKKK